MATSVLGLKTFAASDPVDVNEVNDNYVKIDNGVKTAMQGRAAHNLLDNSDFRNPVNQRGQSSYTGNVYTIDRWALWWDGTTNGTLTINDDGITVTHLLFQNLENADPDKEYTFAVSTANGLHVVSGKPSESPTDGVISITVNEYVQANVNNGGKLYWAALYEGSYTADTLPAYVPKGYAAELAECMRYYYKETEQYAITPYYFSTTERYYTVMLPAKMRIAPTVTYSNVSGEYKDGWAKTNATVTVSATSISHFTMLCSGGTVTETERPLLFMTYEASADL